jgi:aspartate dehydrogenase
MKIGLIGFGSIGQFLLKTINEEQKVPNTRIEWLFDERPDFTEQATEIAGKFGAQFTSSKDQFLKSDTDLILECADPNTAKAYSLDALNSGKNMLIVSAGALTDEDFVNQLTEACRKNGRNVYVPSGAIGGLDAIGAGKASGEIDEVRITTRKPPAALSMEITDGKPVTVFSGTAREAIAKYPQNINVAVTLSLMALGVDQTKVLIVADPALKRNVHEVSASGAFGNVTVTLENFPMPTNPKTSYLAPLSIVALLQRLEQPIKIGM